MSEPHQKRTKILLTLLISASLSGSFNAAQCGENSLKGGTISGGGKGGDPSKLLSDWMSHYYQKPQPDKVPEAMKNFAMLPAEVKDNARMPYAAFMSIVFKQNPNKVQGWVNGVGMSEMDKLVICHALYLSNNDICKVQMAKLADTLSASKKKMVLAAENKKAPDLKIVAISAPGMVDMLWATFMASGDPVYVKRIIALLPDLKSKDTDKFLTATVARWSLKSNIDQHVKVKQIYQDELKKHPDYAALMKLK